MLLCSYCGLDLPPETRCVEGEELYHEECILECIPRRDQAVAKFLKYASYDDHILSMGIHVSYLYGAKQETDDKKKRQKRERKANELLNKVSALRNTNSGSILIHLVGLEQGDRYTGAFDEFADTKLNALIHDGKFFSDVYRKQRLSDHEECCEFHDFLVLFVSAASSVTTSDFKTKIALEDCLLDPTAEAIRTFLREKKLRNDTFHALPEIDSASGLTGIRENRSVQYKSHFSNKVKEDEVVDHISRQLRLKEYITAFTKLEGGCSYFYGIHEKNVTYGKCAYDSKVTVPDQLIVTDETKFKDRLAQRIKETILVCDYDGAASVDAEVAQIRFIPVRQNSEETIQTPYGKRETAKEAVVVHVAVRPVAGIVFYDKQGPVAYKYDENTNTVTRMNITEWFHLFTRRSAPDASTQTNTGQNR